MDQTIELLRAIPWFGWIAIVAIVSGSFTGALNSWLKHRERIEMIRQGMHPDSPEMSKSRVPEI